MYKRIFDSHAHYDDKRFNSDRDALLTRIHTEGVERIVNVGCDEPTTLATDRLTKQYDFIYGTVGFHPHEAKLFNREKHYPLFERYLKENPKLVAIGEIGLDYHYDFSPREVQQQAFEAQLELAKELNRPVVIHSREAHADTLYLLKKYQPRGIIHCYGGSAEQVPELIEMGFYIGFTGVVTFENAKKPVRAVQAVPLDRLLIETDCPYMAPVPHRGQRCDSSMLINSAGLIAKLKGVSVQELLDITYDNAYRAYEMTV